MLKCEICGVTSKKPVNEIGSNFVLNSKIAICNDCWLQTTESEKDELRIKDWRKK